jgi:hypothetical protein
VKGAMADSQNGRTTAWILGGDLPTKPMQINLSRIITYYSNILIYIQKDATLYSLFYLKTALYISGGTTTHHQERKQLYLQHLVFVTPLLLPAAIVEELELV